MGKTYKIQSQRKNKVDRLRQVDKDRRDKLIRIRFDMAQRENKS